MKKLLFSNPRRKYEFDIQRNFLINTFPTWSPFHDKSLSKTIDRNDDLSNRTWLDLSKYWWRILFGTRTSGAGAQIIKFILTQNHITLLFQQPGPYLTTLHNAMAEVVLHSAHTDNRGAPFKSWKIMELAIMQDESPIELWLRINNSLV